MKKITIKDYCLLKREYFKGNSYLSADSLDDKNDYFVMLLGIKIGKISYKVYSKKTLEKIEEGTSPYKDFNFRSYDFSILTLEEASPYLKGVIANNL